MAIENGNFCAGMMNKVAVTQKNVAAVSEVRLQGYKRYRRWQRQELQGRERKRGIS